MSYVLFQICHMLTTQPYTHVSKFCTTDPHIALRTQGAISVIHTALYELN